jgi:D-alanyl-D-alanine carboxypeptidase (penicillin-binding protein 5/6)
MGGTTADLEPGQVYTVQQLLYGLMLPSGNDASVALAVWAGRQLIEHER